MSTKIPTAMVMVGNVTHFVQHGFNLMVKFLEFILAEWGGRVTLFAFIVSVVWIIKLFG
jgi:hypothetical protein